MTAMISVVVPFLGSIAAVQVETCCDPECVNGWCDDGTCRCDFFPWVWEGEACDVRTEPAPCDLACENGSEPDFVCFKCVDENGRTCPDGWCGLLCETQTGTCDQPCVNGVCLGLCPDPSPQCACFGGWTGPTCADPAYICNPPCVNGICNSFGTCACDRGWAGPVCDEPICCEPDCVNGRCDGLNICGCDSGWEGPVCDIQQHLRVDAMVEICGGGDERDEQGTWGQGGELLSLLSQEVTTLGVTGSGVSAVWNAQRSQSSAAAAGGIQLAATATGSNISDVLTVRLISSGACSDCRLKLDFALVGGATVSAPLWGDKVARAETTFQFEFEQFSVSHGIEVRHEWQNCSKIEPCAAGTICAECEGGSFKFRDGEFSQDGFDARICRPGFEPNGDWLCNINDILVSDADASPGSSFSIRANVQYDVPFNLFYSINSNANLFCRPNTGDGCEASGPGCALSLCSSDVNGVRKPCINSLDCNGGFCQSLQFCDINSTNAGEFCELQEDCNGGGCGPKRFCEVVSSNAGEACADNTDCNGGRCLPSFLPEMPAIARSDVTLQLLRVSVVEAVVIEGNLVWVDVPATIEATSGFNYLDPGAPIVSPGLIDSPDLDGDGDTDLDDFRVFLGFFGGPGDPMLPPGADASDLFLTDQNGDNVVDLRDLALLLIAFSP